MRLIEGPDNRCLATLPDGRYCNDLPYAPLPELGIAVCLEHYPAGEQRICELRYRLQYDRIRRRLTAGQAQKLQPA